MSKSPVLTNDVIQHPYLIIRNGTKNVIFGCDKCKNTISMTWEGLEVHYVCSCGHKKNFKEEPQLKDKTNHGKW